MKFENTDCILLYPAHKLKINIHVGKQDEKHQMLTPPAAFLSQMCVHMSEGEEEKESICECQNRSSYLFQHECVFLGESSEVTLPSPPKKLLLWSAMHCLPGAGVL